MNIKYLRFLSKLNCVKEWNRDAMLPKLPVGEVVTIYGVNDCPSNKAVEALIDSRIPEIIRIRSDSMKLFAL